MHIVTIHQPEHLSYLGFFQKVAMSDTLVLLDNVQYEKSYFQNRNRVYTDRGVRYVTVPVNYTGQAILDVPIAREYFASVCRKNVTTIERAYRCAPYWKTFGPGFLDIYSRPAPLLAQYNEALMRYVLDCLGINVNIIHASRLDVSGSKSHLLLDILHRVKADKYIAGKSGRDYLQMEGFDVPVEFQDFHHPVYTQYGHTTFEPYMSVIDALFNVGPEIMSIMAVINRGTRCHTGSTS